MNKYERKIYLEKFKDLEFPSDGSLLFCRQGKRLGQIGLYIGERVGKYQIQWIEKDKKTNPILPYDEDDVRLNLGRKVWVVVEETKRSDV